MSMHFNISIWQASWPNRNCQMPREEWSLCMISVLRNAILVKGTRFWHSYQFLVTISSKISRPIHTLWLLNHNNYLVATPDRKKKQQLCHINLLKPHYAHVSSCGKAELQSSSVGCTVLTAGKVEQPTFPGGEHLAIPDDSVLCGRLKHSDAECGVGSFVKWKG